MKNHFSNRFSFTQKRGIQFKSEKTLKRGNQYKKWKITFQTDFHLFKKGEISLKTFCETKRKKKLENRLLNQQKNCLFINADAKKAFWKGYKLVIFLKFYRIYKKKIFFFTKKASGFLLFLQIWWVNCTEQDGMLGILWGAYLKYNPELPGRFTRFASFCE